MNSIKKNLKKEKNILFLHFKNFSYFTVILAFLVIAL